MVEHITITEQHKLVATAMEAVERNRAHFTAASDRFRLVAAGTERGDADFDRAHVDAFRASL